MASQPNTSGGTPANNEVVAEQPKTVAENMASRRVFAAVFRDQNPEEIAALPEGTAPSPILVKSAVDAASEYLNALAESLSDFGEYPLAAPGIDADGNFDLEVYSDDMSVMVAKLKNKTKVKAIVVAPIPTMDSLLSDAAGTQWAEKILHKELNHVAVRVLREAEDVSTVIDQMPTNRLGYIEAGAADAGILETFNELYKAVNATLATKFPVWAKARLIKSELRKAMESRGYAAEFYPALEDYKGESLFAIAIALAISSAKRKGMDPAIFERWGATRNQKVYDPGAIVEGEEDEDEFDIDSLTESLLSEATPAGTAAAETATTGQTEGGDTAAASGEGAVTQPETAEEPTTAAQPDETAELSEAELEAATAPDSTPPAEQPPTT